MAVPIQGRARLSIILAALLLASSVASAKGLSGANLWPQLAQRDVDAVAEVLGQESIQAYTDSTFQARLKRAILQARQDAARVKGLPDHLVMLDRLAARFNDAHLFAARHAETASVLWPGITVRWTGDRMKVAHSTLAAVPVGAVIDQCNDLPVARWSAQRALEMGLSPRAEAPDQILEFTFELLAERAFVDSDQSLYKPWSHCTFDGVARRLAWRSIDRQDWLKLRPSPSRPAEAHARPLANGEGLWVVLPGFAPDTPQAKAAFLALIEQAPAWRNQRKIVLDVRGNPGGSYQWFVGLLNALYGPEYAGYYARARLQIDPLILLPKPTRPTAVAKTAPALAEASVVPEEPMAEPKDEALDRSLREAKPQPIRGRVLLQVKSLDKAAPGPVPMSLVKAQVLVLTDAGCQSSCIAFIDELKRFPDVRQVGRETGVDSRTGTPSWRTLPSGLATWAWPTMTRPGRARDDNQPHRPAAAYRFDGDMQDEVALERWLVSLPRP